MSPQESITHRIRNTPDEGDVCRLLPGELPGIEEAGAELGFDVLRVDLAGCVAKHDFLDRIAAALGFPEWFGHNWDALADCLADLSWLPETGHILILEHADEFAQEAPAAFTVGVEILREASRIQGELGLPLWVLLDLRAAPETGPRDG
ncbi:MAG TPA: barstar family protein [Rhodocyclaceae bacterium]|nr:barstar family protein [Rhodocyclaceae bacterium]HRQ47975.1 barstar family protein [Rhodocyclaceae bacterium]